MNEMEYVAYYCEHLLETEIIDGEEYVFNDISRVDDEIVKENAKKLGIEKGVFVSEVSKRYNINTKRLDYDALWKLSLYLYQYIYSVFSDKYLEVMLPKRQLARCFLFIVPHWLFEACEFMGLQREPPPRMPANIVCACLGDLAISLRITHIARLQVIKISANAEVLDRVVTHINAFQFIASLDHHLSLGRDREPVNAVDHGPRAVAFHGDFEARGMQLLNQRGIHLQCGLATGQHDETCRKSLRRRHDLLVAHLHICLKVCVTKGTSQVAAAKAYEDGGTSCVFTLALERIKYFVHTFHAHQTHAFYSSTS